MIGHAASDERGKYSGGQAGDQTGLEVCVRTWYNRPWNVVMWARDIKIRESMASAMEKACANPNIGYDQGTSGNSNDRYSAYNNAAKVNFDLSKISVPCETDCSNLVAICANAAGVKISPYIYTGNERAAFNKTGLFEIKVKGVDEEKYFTSDQYIPRGAVLLYEGHHTAINLTNGSSFESKTNKTYKARQEVAVSKYIGPDFETKIHDGLLKTTAELLVRDKPDFSLRDRWYLTKDGYISAYKVEGWVKDTEGWYYERDNHEYYHTCVVKIAGKWYAFAPNGYMVDKAHILDSGEIIGG